MAEKTRKKTAAKPKKKRPSKPSKPPRPKKPGKPPRAAKKRKRRGDAGPDRALVERTVEVIRQTDRAIVTGKRRVGALLLDEYFAGDPQKALARGPGRSATYALLASVVEEATGWTARHLNDCVRIEIVARSLPPDLVAKLGSSHLLRLATIRNPRTREAIARKIAAGELRGSALKRFIAEQAAKEDAAAQKKPRATKGGTKLPGGGGRRRRPDAVLAVAALQRVVDRATDDEAFTLAEIAEVRPKQREELVAELEEASRTLADWVRKLREAPPPPKKPTPKRKPKAKPKKAPAKRKNKPKKKSGP